MAGRAVVRKFGLAAARSFAENASIETIQLEPLDSSGEGGARSGIDRRWWQGIADKIRALGERKRLENSQTRTQE